MSRNLIWVPRNYDKPHRCPQCHRVCMRKGKWGPRSAGRCYLCGLRWRMRSREYQWKVSHRLIQRLVQHRPDLWVRDRWGWRRPKGDT